MANQTGLPAALTGIVGQLTQNSFMTTAKDVVAVKDVYSGIDGKSILNSVTNLFENLDLSFSDILRGGQWIANKVPVITSLVRQGQAAWSRDGLLARAMASSNLVKSAFTSLTSGAQDGLLGELKDYGQVFARINDQVQRVASTNLTDIRSVGNLVNQLTGKNGLFSVDDQDGQVGLIVGIIRDASRVGIPNSFKDLSATLTNTSLIGQVANRVLPDIIQASDHASLGAIGEVLGDKSTYGMMPGVLKNFSTQFTLPPQASAQDTQTLFGQVLDAYGKVDSNWKDSVRQTTTGPVSGVDLTKVLSASGDFIKLVSSGALASNDSSTKLLQLASVLKPQDVATSLKNAFPRTLFNENTVVAQNIISPDALNNTGFQNVGSYSA